MNVTFDFTGRTVAVTGAAQGIGLELARLFLRAGARVVAVDRNPEALGAAWADTPGVRPVEADVADPASAAGVIEAAAVAFLASDEAAYITGVVLPVDGGLSM